LGACSDSPVDADQTIRSVRSHDTIEADTSSMLIRRKLLLYIVVFIAHRSPMMIYRRASSLVILVEPRPTQNH
jgi:hypothetical protein